MSLSNDLISQFAKITNDKTEEKKETTVYGTIKKYGNAEYVQLDGSDLLTPISSTTAVDDGERVTIMIKDHMAIVTGNISSPSAKNSDLKDAVDQISEFEIVIANKVNVEELEAEVARINSLTADNVNIKERLTATEANIGTLEADNVIINNKLTAAEGDIDTLKSTTISADIADLKYAKIDDLNATNAKVVTIEGTYATFEQTVTNKFGATEAEIQRLDAEKVSAKDLDATYANIDFSNIGEAAMEYLYAESGLIENVTIGNGTITGELVGVTIKGDLIEGGTVVADKLVIKGDDGLYYKLNTDGVKTETEQTDYNSLNGSIITANSITATKINVDDLVAFDATIGGFNISENSIYSGVKNSADNTTRGIYLDKEGQVVFGDGSNYVKFYKDTDDVHKLEISANSISLGTTDIKSELDTLSEQSAKNKSDIDLLNEQIVLKVDENTLAEYAKSSELTLTADQLKAEFKATGGYNLIRNSTGKGGLQNWTTNATMGTGINNDLTSGNTTFMFLDGGTSTTESWAFSKRFALKPNTKYTFSGWFYMFAKCISTDIYLLSANNLTESDTTTNYSYTQNLTDGQKVFPAAWTYFTKTFTTTDDVKSGYIRIDNNGYSSSGTGHNRMCWNSIILSEGEEKPWSPHPSEVYDGNTVIDATGVTINNGALTIKNKSGDVQLSGDSNGNLTLEGSLLVITEESDKVWIGENTSKVPDFCTSNPNYQIGVFMGSQLVVSNEYQAWSEGKAISNHSTISTSGISTSGTLNIGSSGNVSGDFEVQTKLTVGKRTSTTPPTGENTFTSRPLVLVPPFHTGGPWKIDVNDTYDQSNLRFNYGTVTTGLFNNVGDFRILRHFYENGVRVVQSGQANSGWYVRYSDGTQICWGGKSVGTIEMVHSQGNAVYGNTSASTNTSGFALTFAASFTSAPFAFADAKSNGYLQAQAYNTSSTTVNLRFWANYSSTHTGTYISYIAIGRWK